ncbi:MAG TPA: hypothetical protein VFH95_13135 [Candidatus Kapabacteria bacterium]|nr:hypothetical protein [Candidatus Kapabacteria bacterium]
MSIRKIAAQAALLLSIFLAGTVVIWMWVMPHFGLQMSDWNDPSKTAKFLIDHKSVFTFYFFFDWVFGITTFVLAAAFTQRFSRRQPWLGIVIGGWGVISAALFLAAGTIGILGTQAAVHDYVLHANLAYAMTAQQLQFGIESCAVAAAGVLTFCAALASSRTKAFGKTVNFFGYLTGIFYVAALPLSAMNSQGGYLSLVGVLAAIVFNIGVAASFMKQPHTELTLAPQAS